jgi:signal transduction histidine kinase
MGTALLLRSFLVLVVAAAPPVVGTIAAIAFVRGSRGGADAALVVGLVVLVSLAWLVVVAAVYARLVRDEITSVLEVAERGAAAESAEGEAPHRRLASTLDERNRQVAELASQVARAPIGDDPRIVARHVVAAAQSVTRDPTWVLAVVESSMSLRLPAGVYDAGSVDPGPLAELHRWALASAADRLPDRTSRVEGPWGAFVVISLAADEHLRALMLAPWEGRPELSASDMALLSLVGEHAATSIQHSVLYDRLRAQAEAIDRMAAVQRDFLRAVTHDLQTPLTSIRAVAAEVRAQPGLDLQSQRDLDMIEHQADRLRRMVAQILAVSRLEAGVVEPQPEVIGPRPVIERTWAALRPSSEHELELQVSGPPMLVVADPDRLEQVLWAVLDNAVKYSPSGGVVGVAIQGQGGRASISISDSGMGMDSATAAHAFEQFFRAPDARRVAPNGSGIGLYAARGLVEAMGGTVSIASQLGRGTTVTIELPAEVVEEGVAPAHHEAS